MALTNEQFVVSAHPHSWFLVADNLHQQAVRLYGDRGQGSLQRKDFRSNSVASWDAVNRTVFLLGGFVLENSLKAFLVYEHPNWISNGRLSRELRTHSLTTLAKRSSLVPYKQRTEWVLKAFEEGIESWARYPCALSVEQTAEEMVVTDHLWDGYVRLTSAYGRRLKALLRKDWNGPHGFSGRFELKGEFLGAR